MRPCGDFANRNIGFKELNQAIIGTRLPYGDAQKWKGEGFK